MLEQYLEKIKEIEKESHMLPEDYSTFRNNKYLKLDLNEFTKKTIAQSRKEQESRQKQRAV